MRKILSEKNLVVVLFVVVLVFFALAQEDARKIEKMYQNYGSSAASASNEPPAPVQKQEKELDLPEAQIR